MLEAIRTLLSHPAFLIVWAITSALSVGVLWWDLRTKNRQIMPLMRAVWTLTVLYSSVVGLAIYYLSGRKQIPDDHLWRRGFRSTAHCYSGCGMGEIIGVTATAGILLLSPLWVSLTTFSLAFAFGFALTIGPLMQEGMAFPQAFRDAAWSESGSIAVMEIVAIGVDLTLAGDARMGNPLFWSSLIVSLTVGLFAAYPVNLWLLKAGIKSGMCAPGHGETDDQDEDRSHAH